MEENTDFAYAMKQLMLDKGKKLIREKLADYIAALKEGYLVCKIIFSPYNTYIIIEYSQGLILPKKDSAETKNETKPAPAAPVKISAQTQVSLLKLLKVHQLNINLQLTGAVKDMKIDTTSFSTRENLFCPINEAFKCFTEQRVIFFFMKIKLIWMVMLEN